ncbi:MAG: ATP-dependent nuclease [Pyrinomonadaceae bacterium]
MRICKIELSNFRGIKAGSVVLPPHAVLLGANNTGKSTIAEALALLAGRERMTRPLSDWDFYGGAPEPESRFYIIATITDFGDGSSTDPTDFPSWFAGDSARPVWWDETSSTLSNDADPPTGTKLAAQIAMAGLYDDEACDFETRRFFYDGPCDPFTEDHRRIPVKLMRDLGLFLLPGNREWEHLLAFSSSSFLKLLREYDAVPGRSIETLKNELRAPTTKIEEQDPFREILSSAEQELKSFTLVGDAGRLVYRPTSLDALSVLRSLVAHVDRGADGYLPLARHGSGTVSLQAFLLLLAFGKLRKGKGQNFILVAEEPELHLHPSLHSRLVQRIRGASTQSVITTQSPNVAACYQPSEVIFARNVDGELQARRMRDEPISNIATNSIRKLYLRFRENVYQALMGGIVVVPEGELDYQWLHLWQRVAEASPDVAAQFDLRPVSIIPTSDAAVVATWTEIAQFRPDVVAFVDGDSTGITYANQLTSLTPPPKRTIRLGTDGEIEHLSAWIIEPALANPGPTLSNLLPDSRKRSITDLSSALFGRKKDRELHENLAWEALENSQCAIRAGEFVNDIAAIASGQNPSNTNWSTETPVLGSQLFVANHISKA